MSAAAATWEYRTVAAPRFGRLCDEWLNFECDPGDGTGAWELDRGHGWPDGSLDLIFVRDTTPGGAPMTTTPRTEYRVCFPPVRGRIDAEWLNRVTHPADGADFELHTLASLDGDTVVILARPAQASDAAREGHGLYNAQEQRPQRWQQQARGSDGKFGKPE